ncbi:MAG: dihydropteroate synthase [Bacteroidales bacterium]|nr:dihydropteroate synthase [Bacteroidales bacterium]
MAHKNTFFPVKKTCNFRGKLVHIDSPLIMGIINLTPDSFYQGSRVNSHEELILRAETMLKEGAHILDIGACSTRPGAEQPDEDTERRRLFPALQVLRKNFPDAVLSVDTWRASIAKEAVYEYGVDMINDISAGNMDPDMFQTVAECKIPYLLMHMQGTPQTMQKNPVYQDVVQDILAFFALKTEELVRKYHVHDIFIDPGFGFGKTLEHNYILLENLDAFRILGFPVVAGISRKSMIHRILACTPEEALNGTTVLHTIALLRGASVLRVHDVKPASEAIRLVSFLKKANTDQKGK